MGEYCIGGPVGDPGYCGTPFPGKPGVGRVGGNCIPGGGGNRTGEGGWACTAAFWDFGLADSAGPGPGPGLGWGC